MTTRMADSSPRQRRSRASGNWAPTGAEPRPADLIRGHPHPASSHRRPGIRCSADARTGLGGHCARGGGLVTARMRPGPDARMLASLVTGHRINLPASGLPPHPPEDRRRRINGLVSPKAVAAYADHDAPDCLCCSSLARLASMCALAQSRSVSPRLANCERSWSRPRSQPCDPVEVIKRSQRR